MEALATDSLQKAEKLFRSALQKEPALKSNALLYQYIGQIQERREEYEKALESYTMGINISPTTMGLLLCRASLHLGQGRNERALADYNAVLELNEDHTEALFFRAYIRMQQNLYKQARADYERLIRLDPNHRQGRLGLVLLNDRDGRPREALEQINSLIVAYPTDADLYAVRGGMEQQRKQYESAITDMNRAIELAPRRADLYLNRASLLLEMRKKKAARQDCHRALELGATKEDVAFLLKEATSK